jgi:hypothetical protein
MGRRPRWRRAPTPVALAAALALGVTGFYGVALVAADEPVARLPCPHGSISQPESDIPVWEDDPVVAPKKKAWEDALGGQVAARPAVRARLKGWPAVGVVPAGSLPASDQAFLERLARDTWRGLDAFTDREHGLPIDHVRLEGAGDAAPAGLVGDYTNITNVGLHLVALVAASELGLVTPAAAAAAVDAVLDTLARLETHEGFFFNYYDTTTLERTSNFISFVDSAWLTTGLIVARAAFPPLAARTSALIERMNYRFFYDERLGLLSHGYFVHRRTRSRYHYGVLYTEARLGALLAVGRGDVPERVWFDMVRTFPPTCEGQSAMPIAAREKTVRGHAVWGGYYEWEGIRYVPSWGGSMFEALMPTLVLDEARIAPESLGPNDVAHATVQRRWALETLGYPVWGLSPSAVPPGDRYREYGVRVLGSRGYGAGVVTPHASALALAASPPEAVANLRRLTERYAIYGDYGFYDAVDPLSGQVAPVYLTLDQAMTLIALANHLRPHVIQQLFASDPIVRRAVAIVGDERFFE